MTAEYQCKEIMGYAAINENSFKPDTGYHRI